MTIEDTRRASPWPNEEEQERERQMKREALLRAAAISFTERGFRATSLDSVAASLGITKPTIYHYFSNKEEILYEVASEGLRAIRDAVEPKKGANGLERLRAMLVAYAKSVTVDYGKCVVRTQDYDLSAEGRQRLAARKREIDQAIRDTIEDGIADGSIAPCDVKLATFVVTGALNWIARWHNPKGELSDDEIARNCTDIILNGLATRR